MLEPTRYWTKNINGYTTPPVLSAGLQKRLRWIILFPYLGQETTQLETFSLFVENVTPVRNLD
jgi:hypothetical protein